MREATERGFWRGLFGSLPVLIGLFNIVIWKCCRGKLPGRLMPGHCKCNVICKMLKIGVLQPCLVHVITSFFFLFIKTLMKIMTVLVTGLCKLSKA